MISKLNVIHTEFPAGILILCCLGNIGGGRGLLFTVGNLVFSYIITLKPLSLCEMCFMLAFKGDE